MRLGIPQLMGVDGRGGGFAVYCLAPVLRYGLRGQVRVVGFTRLQGYVVGFFIDQEGRSWSLLKFLRFIGETTTRRSLMGLIP